MAQRITRPQLYVCAICTALHWPVAYLLMVRPHFPDKQGPCCLVHAELRESGPSDTSCTIPICIKSSHVKAEL